MSFLQIFSLFCCHYADSQAFESTTNLHSFISNAAGQQLTAKFCDTALCDRHCSGTSTDSQATDGTPACRSLVRDLCAQFVPVGNCAPKHARRLSARVSMTVELANSGENNFMKLSCANMPCQYLSQFPKGTRHSLSPARHNAVTLKSLRRIL